MRIISLEASVRLATPAYYNQRFFPERKQLALSNDYLYLRFLVSGCHFAASQFYSFTVEKWSEMRENFDINKLPPFHGIFKIGSYWLSWNVPVNIQSLLKWVAAVFIVFYLLCVSLGDYKPCWNHAVVLQPHVRLRHCWTAEVIFSLIFPHCWGLMFFASSFQTSFPQKFVVEQPCSSFDFLMSWNCAKINQWPYFLHHLLPFQIIVLKWKVQRPMFGIVFYGSADFCRFSWPCSQNCMRSAALFLFLMWLPY